MDTLLYLMSDPVWRGPFWSTLFLGMSSGLVGVVFFLKKQSLIGETLSHAAYPGLMVMAMVLSIAGVAESGMIDLFAAIGAFIFALLGVGFLSLLKRYHFSSDSSACWVLSSFLGLGVLMASWIQFQKPLLYQQMQNYLYGQAALLRDVHTYTFLIVLVLISLLILLFYKEIQLALFNKEYARFLGGVSGRVDQVILITGTLVVILGIRAGGVLLMAALLITPVVCARQLSDRLSLLFLYSAISGGLIALTGTVMTHTAQGYTDFIYIPLGPSMVLVGVTLALLMLLISPKEGLLARGFRALRFKFRCLEENLLKLMWRQEDSEAGVPHFMRITRFSKLGVWWAIYQLKKAGMIQSIGSSYVLTDKGREKAQYIIHLHDLWAIYMCTYLEAGSKRVHASAEEIEHIMDKDTQSQLEKLLSGISKKKCCALEVSKRSNSGGGCSCQG